MFGCFSRNDGVMMGYPYHQFSLSSHSKNDHLEMAGLSSEKDMTLLLISKRICNLQIEYET